MASEASRDAFANRSPCGRMPLRGPQLQAVFAAHALREGFGQLSYFNSQNLKFRVSNPRNIACCHFKMPFGC